MSHLAGRERDRRCCQWDSLMDEGFRQQIATFEHRLSHLLRDGFDLQRTLSVEPGAPELDAMRTWQGSARRPSASCRAAASSIGCRALTAKPSC